MHGFWWPGRQVVVVLPLAAWWCCGGWDGSCRGCSRSLLLSGLVGVAHYAALLVGGWAGRITWVVSFEGVEDPLYQILRPFFPDYRGQRASDSGCSTLPGWSFSWFCWARRAFGAAPVRTRRESID